MDDTLIGRFLHSARAHPDHPAVVGAMPACTYRELHNRSAELAGGLRERGVGPGRPVAVQATRSADLLAAVLAVVRLGAFYVPIHDEYPLGRVEAILHQMGGAMLLTDRPDAPNLRGLPCTPLGELAGTEPYDGPGGPATHDTAYVMFTSGSSGAPKGVQVTHRNVLSLLDDPLWAQDTYHRHMMVSPFGYGMSTYEIWGPLTRGNTVVLHGADRFDVSLMRREIREHGVTSLHLTAGLFRVVAEEWPESLAGLAEVMTGGDAVSAHAVAKVRAACPGLRIRVFYGATETTLFTTTKLVGGPVGSVVPVGRPLHGRKLTIRGGSGEVPPGEVGEVIVSGPAVTSGYYGRPDLTAAAFGGHGDEREYRTGDLGMIDENGDLVLCGRRDDQIKIRGFRVEPSEVEYALGTHRDVADAVVVAGTGPYGEPFLAAHVVTRAEPDAAALRDYLERLLPPAMVPATFRFHDALPLNRNGKIDRKALADVCHD